LLLAATGQAQAFDVASVKPSPSTSSPAMHMSGGRFNPTLTLKVLMQTAYHVQGFQILGEPGWADTQLYDIDARSAA